MGIMDDAISQAILARLLDQPTLHHRALYECCQLDSHELVNGVEDEDGVLEVLCSEDIRACMDARTHLAKENIDMLLTRFSTCPEGCHKLSSARTTECTKARLQLSNDSSAAARDIDYDPLRPSTGVYESVPYFLCRTCAEFCIRRDKEVRQSIFDRLGDILGLAASEEAGADMAE